MAEMHEINHGESFVRGVNLILSDSPCNLRKAREDEHYDYESSTAGYMTDFLSWCKKVM